MERKSNMAYFSCPKSWMHDGGVLELDRNIDGYPFIKIGVEAGEIRSSASPFSMQSVDFPLDKLLRKL
jgi:hypothetical protein